MSFGTAATTCAVELEAVSKRYSIGDRRGLLSRSGPRQTLWALRDVSLRVARGESVGLIGHNGAGKTSLLRLLAGITRTTSGRVRTSGRVASLINLGAGFHPELTGRENVYLNGVILGLTRREVRDRFDQIVDFADLGAYIDTPLKRYSSGMIARLGFAVASFVEPDVLLVDEVLSVGDVAFQDRSIRKMLSFRDSGQAILFVSHNLSAVEMMCQRTIWLDHGTVRMEGPTANVVGAYLESVDAALIEATIEPASVGLDGVALAAHDAAADGREDTPRRKAPDDTHERSVPGAADAIGSGKPDAAPTHSPRHARPSSEDLSGLNESQAPLENSPYSESGGAVVIGDISLSDTRGQLCTDFDFGDQLRVHVRSLATQLLHEVSCTLTVRGDYGPLFSATSDVFATWTPGVHELDCVFWELPLLPGLYRLEVELTHSGAPTWSLPRAVSAFRIVTDLAEYGSDSVVGATKSRGGFLAVAYDWRLQSTEGEHRLSGLRLPRNISASRPP